MNRSRAVVFGVSLAAAAMVVLAPREGRATAAVKLTEASITRQTAFRPQAQNPFWISHADCVADDVMTFPLYVSDYTGNSLQVWAGSGSDCLPVAARQGSAAVCWKLTDLYAPTGNSISVTVKVRDIVGKHLAPAGPGSGTLEDCSPASAGSTSAVAVTLYFMFLDGGSNNMGGIPWSTKFDLLGPSSISSLSIGKGDTMLKLDWNQPTADTDLTGYQFFCDPIQGAEGQESNGTPFEASVPVDALTPTPEPEVEASAEAATCDLDASDGGDASCPETSATDSATTTSETSTDVFQQSACPSTKLSQGIDPEAAWFCGSVTGANATSGRITGLQNKYTYSVAVAGVDGVGNVGKLSNIVCTEPWPVDDFFKLYREAGGGGGGAFCSVGAVGQGAGMATLGVLAIAALARMARRRREES